MFKKASLLATLAMAVSLGSPQTASAIAPPLGCVGAVTLGFGGYFSGCHGGFTVARYFENASHVSNMYWFAGVPTRDPVTNAPTPSGSLLFNNNCGSNGLPGSGVFCNPNLATTFVWGLDDELVFGLNNLNQGSWLYSGTDPNRNDPPAPAGIQNWLWQIQGGNLDGWYLFGWEDLNSGCIGANSTSGSNVLLSTTVVDGTQLGASLVNCHTSNNPGWNSDNDYNDFYVLVRPLTPDEVTEIVPEPMTMTLMATGLLGMGGASAVRRRRKQQ